MSDPVDTSYLRPTRLGGPFEHRFDSAGICRVCGHAQVDLLNIGWPPNLYKDNGERLTNATDFERAARELGRNK